MTTNESIYARRASFGLALFRVVVGVVFVMHGGQKLFTLGVGAVSEGFAQAGIPLASVAAPAISLIELIGGAALALGLFTPVAASLIAAVMAGAIIAVHLPAGFFLPNGYEFALTLFAGAIALVLAGPGAFALDNVLHRRRSANESAKPVSGPRRGGRSWNRRPVATQGSRSSR